MKKFIFLLAFFPCSAFAASNLTVNNSQLTINNALVVLNGVGKYAAAASGIAFVQSTGCANVGAVCSATFSATVGNNLIACAGISTGENMAASQFTDKSGNTYTSTAPSAGTSSESLGVYKLNATGGSSFWVKFNIAGAAALSMTCWEISGATALDTSNGRTATSASYTSATMNTSATDVILGAVTYEGGTTTITPDGTYTQDFEQEDNSRFQAINGSHKTVAAGNYTFNGTLGTSAVFRISTMAFK